MKKLIYSIIPAFLLLGISCSSNPSLTKITGNLIQDSYYVGEVVNKSSFNVNANYSDNSVKKIDDFTINGLDEDNTYTFKESDIGSKTFDISYLDKKTSISTTVKKNEITTLKVSFADRKMSYMVDDKIYKSNFIVTGIYGNKKEENITNFTIKEFADSDEYTFIEGDKGTKTFNVQYMNASGTITVSVTNSKYEVSEEEWQEAIEYLHHINKNYELNYTTSGKLKFYTYKNGEIYSVVDHNKYDTNDNLEYVDIVRTGNDKTSNLPVYCKCLDDYGFKYGIYYYLFNGSTKTPTLFTKLSGVPAREDTYGNYFDFYDDFSSFGYSNGIYYWTFKFEDSIDFVLGIAFNEDHKIDQIGLDYILDGGTPNKLEIRGSMNINYGASTLSMDDFPKDFNEKINTLDNNESYTLNNDNNYSLTHEKIEFFSHFIEVDSSTTFSDKNQLNYKSQYDEDDPFYAELVFKVYKISTSGDKTILTLGEEEDQNDFWVKDEKTLTFKKGLQEGEKLLVHMKSLNLKMPNRKLNFSFTNPN